MAPPVALSISSRALLKFSHTHPDWFERVERRCGPGLSRFRETGDGSGIFQPAHRSTESWQRTFFREDVDNAPNDWISERSLTLARHVLAEHETHALTSFPEEDACPTCDPRNPRSWKEMAYVMWTGDADGLTVLGQPLYDDEGVGLPEWQAVLERNRQPRSSHGP